MRAIRAMARALIVGGATGAFYLVAAALATRPGAAFVWWHPEIAAFLGCAGSAVGGLALLGVFSPGCPDCRRLTSELAETRKALVELRP